MIKVNSRVRSIALNQQKLLANTLLERTETKEVLKRRVGERLALGLLISSNCSVCLLVGTQVKRREIIYYFDNRRT